MCILEGAQKKVEINKLHDTKTSTAPVLFKEDQTSTEHNLQVVFFRFSFYKTIHNQKHFSGDIDHHSTVYSSYKRWNNL